ncbi:uncharacterized protein GIQ15_02361 [Arthroderma uncinatum]|uniref:uncharacterized protein n=1 Tax=Arthroderma uncinatum TaxID=74035 RepID=UPI00144A65BC|nr:uncharacterized protein GIQ15_02361 [Arthroderma uncinatum]KAF3483037.1 hypothetical protein GIQ15_02361 [Arthroderma uncinatum]
MAEQSSNDVVNQTRSGGDLSPSDVPASKLDNLTAGGDRGDVKTSENSSTLKVNADTSQEISTGSPSSTEANGVGTENHDADASLSPNIGDGSGGSDTDASRPDARANTDGTQHSRTSSVKRPASFKPVSFAKFSVTKPPGSNGNSKSTPEKAPFSSSTPPSSTSTPLSSRPRLVAKSGSGLRDSSPRTSTVGSKNLSGAPDANLVWNKNRPVQPPPTKHLTDEELKQQYGIHMTSRIQTDNNEKEAKWADIDDDEDDWAPETIEWNDGTKITLTHTEGAAPGSQETNGPTTNSADPGRQPSPANNAPPAREAPRLLLAKPSSSLGSNTTILKVGASAEKQQFKQGGDLSKSPNEKSTLTSKGPAAVRSPWAPLPPVEKASPLALNPPAQAQPPARLNQGELPGLDTVSAPPAKEIAADDFNRSWRDRQPAAPRELYNSQSGRYEPVSDSRHGPPRNDKSAKNDGHFRPASLLQRSMHNEQSGPAEPSAAFQTHRSPTEGSSWGRRRTSSNVSGGSGGFVRRMSLSRPDLPFKGGPPSTGTIERSASPSTRQLQNGPIAPSIGSPSQQSHRSLEHGPASYHQPPPNSQSNAPPQGAAEVPTSQPPVVEDPVAMQQRIMREKREMARQRRLEQEAKEEAAKQERIRIKLQSMGVPAKELPGAKDAAATSGSEPKRPAGQPATATTVASPPKPPVPELRGEPKQYGMMKVHHPESVKKLVASSEKAPEKPQQSGNQTQNHQVSPSHEQPRPEASPAANGSKPVQEPQPKPSQPIYGPQPEERPPNWKYSVPSTSTYTWPSSKGHAATLGALWGPPTNDKALGNGTFDRNLTSFPSDLGSLGLAEQPHIYPQPGQEGVEMPEGMPRPLPGPPKTIPDAAKPLSPLTSPDARPERIGDNPKPIAPPGPIAPPSYNQGQRWQQDRPPHRGQETAAWSNFHLVARKSEAEENERFHQDLKALREEEARTGISPSLQATFNETWRQVEAGERPGNRNIIGVVAKSSDKDAQPSPFHQIDSVSGLPFTDKQKPVPLPPTRGSRFFPHGAEPKRQNNQETTSARSQSPPPPEEVSSHPVFTGDSQRPLVHLPNPKPRVKLPPGALSAPSPPPPPPVPATFAAMVASPPPVRAPPQPIASTTSWQDRFNGLFGKKTTQPAQRKNSSLAVASATKEPLDVVSSVSSAAVSLPQRGEKRKFTDDSDKVTTKEVEDEEAIFEDREAGSLPVVKVPYMAPRAAWHPAPKQSRFRTKYQKPVLSQSIEPYILSHTERDSNGDIVVTVRPPGKDVKKILLPKRGGGNANAARLRSNPKSRTRNPRSREGSGSYQNSQTAKKTGPTTSTSTTPTTRAGSPKSRPSSVK